jgi:hypothetical protein
MYGNERNGPKPIDRDRRRPAAAPRAQAAGLPRDPTPPSSPSVLPVPLLLTDPTCLVRCSRREALILLAGIALLSPPALAAPTEEDSRLRRMMARFAADPRMEQKVSITAWSEPLEDLLTRLAPETGVMLRFEGREVGDQRVNVVLRDQPLSRALALLSDALDLYWRRERKTTGDRYVLFQDARSRKREQELTSRARERFEEGIRRLIASRKPTPAEIEQLSGRDLWEAGGRRAAELFARVAPRHWEPLMQAGRVEVPFASLSPGDQALVRDYVAIINKRREQKNQERGTPGFRIVRELDRPGSAVVLEIYDGVPVGLESEFGIDVRDADGSGNGSGLALGYTPEEWRQLHETSAPPGYEKERRNSPPDGGPRLTASWSRWEDKTFLPWEEILQAVVKNANLQIIGDSYLYYWWEANTTVPNPSTLPGRPLAEVLDAIAPPFFYVWRREEDVYLFRHRNGFLEKRHNVPERHVRRWRAHLKDGALLPLEDLAEVALLTDRQRGMVNHRGIPTRSAGAHRNVLRFYGALEPYQRARLQTTGLRVGELGPPQVEILRAWKPAAEAGPDALLRLRREEEAVVFQIATEGSAPQEERVPLERGHEPTGP